MHVSRQAELLARGKLETSTSSPSPNRQQEGQESLLLSPAAGILTSGPPANHEITTDS